MTAVQCLPYTICENGLPDTLTLARSGHGGPQEAAEAGALTSHPSRLTQPTTHSGQAI